VISAIWEKGEYIEQGLSDVIQKHDLSKNVSLAGYSVRLMVNTHGDDGLQDPLLASLYQQEMFKNGILCFSGVLMLSFSHTKEDLDLLINAFDKACEVIKTALNGGNPIDDYLECVPGAPVFKNLRERNAVSN
jgi:glutamate-1-semialdehyde aminotransferase